MVKRYRTHAMVYGTGLDTPFGQATGNYEVVSPIGTRLCTGKKEACDLIVAALNAHDPKGECSL